MEIQAEKKRFTPSRKIVGAGALGLSAVLHFAILFLVGSVVIIQGVLPHSNPKGEILHEVVTETPVDTEDPVAPHDNTPVEEPVAAPTPAVMDNFGSTPEILTATATSEPAFTMPASAAIVSTPGFHPPTTTHPDAVNKPQKPIREMPTRFGGGGTSSDGLVGSFYDLKQNSNRVAQPYSAPVFEKVVADFIKSGWDPKILSPYYKVKKEMVASEFCLPQMDAKEVPKAFGVERDVKPMGIVIHYQGAFISPKSGTFRFAGNGDDILFVRLNKKDVLNTSAGYAPASPLATPYPGSKVVLSAGQWFELSKGHTYSIEVLIGERPGGLFHAFLMIQGKTEKYDIDPLTNAPILPLFQVVPTKTPKYTPFPAAPHNPATAREAFAGLEADETNP